MAIQLTPIFENGTKKNFFFWNETRPINRDLVFQPKSLYHSFLKMKTSQLNIEFQIFRLEGFFELGR